MLKRFVIVFLLLVLVCGGLIGFNIYREQAIQDYFATMPQPSVTVSATEVAAVTWSPSIAAVGTVNAVRGIEVAVEVRGVVREIFFESNARVEEGQLLVQLDDSVERADMLAVRAAIERDRQALDRARTLNERGVSATASVENADSALAASLSELERIEALLDQKAIEAPFSGTIGIPRVDVGAYVSPGTPLATLQDLDVMEVDFTIREQDLRRLSIGQAVRVGLTEADPAFTAKVTGIEPQIDPRSRLVAIRAVIEGHNDSLNPGQFVHVEVVLPTEEDVIAVPQTAVVSSLYGDYVYVVARENGAPGAPDGDAEEAPAEDAEEGGGIAGSFAGSRSAQAQEGAETATGEQRLVARQVFVETGRRTDGMVEIESGIEAGQRVVTAGQNKLASGAPVTVDNSIDPQEIIRRGGTDQ